MSDEWLEKLFRPKDKEETNGIAFARDADQFKVILTTRFGGEDFEEYLLGNDWGLCKPKEQYVFIVINPE